MIRVSKLDPHDIKAQFSELPKRLESARHAMGSMIAESLQETIRKNIPGRQGWLGIYHDAVQFSFDGTQWAIAGEANVPIQVLDATKTYVAFIGDDPQSKILADYNPWVLHMIPAINQPYRGRMRVTTAGPSDVEAAERRLSPLLPSIKQRLSTAGFAIVPNGIPMLDGVATADLRHMAYQLEFGRPPFDGRPSPHWRTATLTVGNTLEKSLAKLRSKFEAILKGQVVSKPKKTTSGVKALLAASRQLPVPKPS